MKVIVAVIQPDRLDEVMDRLSASNIHQVTVSCVMGRGRQKGVSTVYRSHREAGNLLRKIKLEIAVDDRQTEVAVGAIVGGARSGYPGDGKVFVMNLDRVLRIRTGDSGSSALG